MCIVIKPLLDSVLKSSNFYSILKVVLNEQRNGYSYIGMYVHQGLRDLGPVYSQFAQVRCQVHHPTSGLGALNDRQWPWTASSLSAESGSGVIEKVKMAEDYCVSFAAATRSITDH